MDAKKRQNKTGYYDSLGSHIHCRLNHPPGKWRSGSYQRNTFPPGLVWASPCHLVSSGGDLCRAMIAGGLIPVLAIVQYGKLNIMYMYILELPLSRL